MRPGTLLALLVLGMSGVASAETVVYAVHVGTNEPPPDSGLSKLHFADDDAARFYRFTEPFAGEAVLAAVLDAESQRRFSGLATKCILPTRESIATALAKLAGPMTRDRAAGKKVVFYFSFSGHGVLAGGETQLAVLNGVLDRSWIEGHVLPLPVDSIHLFIDACHAEGVVASRGVIEKEASATTRELSDQEKSQVFRDDLLDRYPNVGALVAATSDREAHEWSRLESGVFTHEVLSALSGAADVNGDGEIAYSEAAAFISAANRAVKDRRATLDVISLPPRLDRRTPILSRSWMRGPAILAGTPAALGHFFIETNDGVRVLDAHPDKRVFLRLLVPPDQRIWVYSSDLEASFESVAGNTVSFASLEYRKTDQILKRGSIEDALRKGFFSTPFGSAYYLGWVDREEDVPVSIEEPTISSSTARPPTASTLCLIGSGATGALTILLGVLAWQAKADYDNTNLQRPAQEAWDRMTRYRGLAIGSGLATAGLAVAAWLLFPEESWTLSPTPGKNSFGVSLSVRW